MPAGPKKTGGLWLAGGTMLSRLLALLRDVALAWALGGSWVADCFLAAFRLPNFFRRLFGEGALALAFVPPFTEGYAQDPSGAFNFSRAAFYSLLAIFSLAALCAFFPAAYLFSLLAPGFASRPEHLELGTRLLRICLWYLPLAAGAALLSGIWLGQGEYRRPAMQTACFNIGILAAIGLLFLQGASGPGAIPDGPSGLNAPSVFSQQAWFVAQLLALGVLAGGLLQLAAQIPGLARRGFALFGPLNPRGPANRRFLRRLPPLLLGSGGQQLGVLATTLLASFLAEGSIAALYFAERLFEFPLGLVGVALGLAALPELSGLGAGLGARLDGANNGPGADNLPGHGNPDLPAAWEKFCAITRRAALLAWAFSLPAAVGLWTLAPQIVDLLFWHGAFGAQDAARVTLVLRFYVLGLPAAALCRPLLSALSALQMGPACMKASLAALLATLLAGGFGAWRFGLGGVGAAAAFGAWVNCALLGIFLQRALKRIQEGIGRVEACQGGACRPEAGQAKTGQAEACPAEAEQTKPESAPGLRAACGNRRVLPRNSFLPWLFCLASSLGMGAFICWLLALLPPSSLYSLGLAMPLGALFYGGIGFSAYLFCKKTGRLK